MRKEELLERYEALGEERDFLAAQPLYEEALAQAPDAPRLNEYGYLLFAHARRELRRAVQLYERAIALDPGYDKAHYQLIIAWAALQETELAVRMYEQRLRETPAEVREYRFLATAYLSARMFERALAVAAAGLELAPDDAALVAMGGRGEGRSRRPGGRAGRLAAGARARARRHRSAVQQRLSARAGRAARRGDRGVAGDHRVERVAWLPAAVRVAEAGARTAGRGMRGRACGSLAGRESGSYSST